MKCSEWINLLEELAPPQYACEWDNPGLIAGRSDKEIRKVVIALDAKDNVVDLAVSENADLLITHHPLIFHPVRSVNDRTFIGRRLMSLIKADISYYAMHTNFDIAPGCMADLASDRIGLTDTVPLEVTGEKDGELIGIGKVGTLPYEMTVRELADKVKDAFGLPFITAFGTSEVNGKVSRVAICPGSGRDMKDLAVSAGASVLITGDIGHHEGIDAAACGLAILDAGHYGLEHIFIDFMADFCRENIDHNAEIIKAPEDFPITCL